MLFFTIYFSKQLNKPENTYFLNSTLQDIALYNDPQTKKLLFIETLKLHRIFAYIIDSLVISIVTLNLLAGIKTISKNYIAVQSEIYNFFLVVNKYNFIPYFIFIFYFVFFEKTFGYTCGKTLINSEVVNIAGNRISIWQAFGRCFSRFTPFDWISAFAGRMCHDSWTNTFVVDGHTSQAQHKVNDVGVLY